MGLFDFLFDLDGNGEVEVDEKSTSIKITHRVVREISIDFSDSDDTDEPDTSWRNSCEDGSKYDIDPEDYDDEEDYLDALNEAKYGWREDCDDEGSDYDIDPEDYETEDEYNEAVKKAKFAWREDCDDGSEYGIDPNDYDTEEEYYDAIEEAESSEERLINFADKNID